MMTVIHLGYELLEYATRLCTLNKCGIIYPVEKGFDAGREKELSLRHQSV